MGNPTWTSTGRSPEIDDTNHFHRGRGDYVEGLAVNNAPVTVAKEVTFTEVTADGTLTGAVAVPAGATIHDIIVVGVALWTAATSATMKVGDGTDDDGFYTGVNLKATDLLAGETLSFALSGGKNGAYITATHANSLYGAAARTISGIITKVGSGTAGRTRMIVIYSVSNTENITAAS